MTVQFTWVKSKTKMVAWLKTRFYGKQISHIFFETIVLVSGILSIILCRIASLKMQSLSNFCLLSDVLVYPCDLWVKPFFCSCHSWALSSVAAFLFCLPALLECSSLRQSEQIDIRSVSVKNCSLPFEWSYSLYDCTLILAYFLFCGFLWFLWLSVGNWRPSCFSYCNFGQLKCCIIGNYVPFIPCRWQCVLLSRKQVACQGERKSRTL